MTVGGAATPTFSALERTVKQPPYDESPLPFAVKRLGCVVGPLGQKRSSIAPLQVYTASGQPTQLYLSLPTNCRRYCCYCCRWDRKEYTTMAAGASGQSWGVPVGASQKDERRQHGEGFHIQLSVLTPPQTHFALKENQKDEHQQQQK